MSGNWPGTAGLPAVPTRAAWGRKSIQLPIAKDNGETDAPELLWGLGNPNGVVTGVPGDTFLATDTGYVWKKSSGVGNTGWTLPGQVFDVKAYGAKGDGVADDYTAITATITALVAAGGGVLWFPLGSYAVSQAVVVPASSTISILVDGAGLRNVDLFGTTAGQTVLQLGATVPDNAGTTTNAHYYGQVRNLTINGSSCPTGMGLYCVESHRWRLSHLLIQNFTGTNGRGLWLQGSTTPGSGVGSSAAPHFWKNTLDTITVANCLRPLVLQNADENLFLDLVATLPPGLTASANSLIAVEIRQGRNNSFVRAQLGGERDETLRQAYVAVKFCTPVRADGTTDGDVLGNVFDGLEIEGFGQKAIWNESSSCFANGARDVNAAFWGASNATPGPFWSNGGTQTGSGFFIDAPYHKVRIYDEQGSSGDPVTLTLTVGNQTPDVTMADAFVLVGNGGGSAITGFNAQLGVNGSPVKTFLLSDSNVAFTHGANLTLVGTADFTTGKAGDLISFRKFGSVWREVGRVIA